MPGPAAVPAAMAPADSEGLPAFAVAPAELARRIAELEAFVRGQMREGVDYGRIPGSSTPVLLKPGAEKLAALFGFSIVATLTETVDDLERGYIKRAAKVELVSKRTGLVEATGLGEANSLESRYRYRWVFESELPANLDKSQFKVRTVNTKHGRARMYRIENDDIWTLANTLTKMAKKRALVDAVLSATRLSGVLTQDLEDLAEPGQEAPPAEEPGQAPAAKPRTTKPAEKPAEKPKERKQRLDDPALRQELLGKIKQEMLRVGLGPAEMQRLAEVGWDKRGAGELATRELVELHRFLAGLEKGTSLDQAEEALVAMLTFDEEGSEA